jgi:cold shock CspA family protein
MKPKVFGFITNDETGEGRVCSRNCFTRRLRINEGDAVSFEEEAGKKGTQAANIELI